MNTNDRALMAARAPRCNRAEYLAWRKGLLLCFRRGRGFAVDQACAEAADAALDRGEVVVMTDVSGVPITVLIPEQDEIREYEIDPWLKDATREPTKRRRTGGER